MYPHKYFNPETKLYYNSTTQRWVKRIRDERDRNSKVETSEYKVIHFISVSLDNYLPSYRNDSNILTRVSWFLRIIYNSNREATHQFKYFSIPQLRLILGSHYKTIIMELKTFKLINEQELINTHNTDQFTHSFQLGKTLTGKKTVRATVKNKKVITAMKKYEEKYRFINVSDEKMRKILLANHNRAFINVFEPDDFVDLFNNDKQDHNYSIDDYGHRTHTIFTRMTKQLRMKVRDIKDIKAEVCELDITNSQPYCILLIFQAQQHLPKIVSDNVCKQLSFLSEVTKTKAYSEYCKDVLSGQIYDNYALALDEQISDWYRPNEFVTKRKQAKSLFYQIVFAADYHTAKIETEKNILFEIYPEVFEAINNIKQLKLYDDFKEVNDYKPYKNITILLQRIESLLTNMMYSDLYDNKIWALKCHDSFLIKENDLANAIQLMFGVCSRLEIALTPLTFYNKENAEAEL